MQSQRTLEEILQSTSDNLFPADLGDALVEIDSVGCDGDTPLHVLIWRDDTEGALILIENGALINACGDMGETPLHIAIHKKNKNIIDALITKNARTDIFSEFGQTALDKAKKNCIKIN